MHFVFLMLVSVNVCNDKTIMLMFVTVTFMLVYSLGFTEIAAACSYVFAASSLCLLECMSHAKRLRLNYWPKNKIPVTNMISCAASTLISLKKVEDNYNLIIFACI